MEVIESNKEKTVGIITNPGEIQHIGSFTPALLKEWWKMVAQVYGEDQSVHLFVRKSDANEGWAIFASSNGENPYVAVCGEYPADGEKWEEDPK